MSKQHIDTKQFFENIPPHNRHLQRMKDIHSFLSDNLIDELDEVLQSEEFNNDPTVPPELEGLFKAALDRAYDNVIRVVEGYWKWKAGAK